MPTRSLLLIYALKLGPQFSVFTVRKMETWMKTIVD